MVIFSKEETSRKSGTIVEEESNFWYSVLDKEEQPLVEEKVPSAINNLDVNGFLPDDCYYRSNSIRGIEDSKQFCRVATDISDMIQKDEDSCLSYMHRCIDSGLTTFYGGTPFVYSQLLQDTPKTILNQCNLVTSVTVPSKGLSNPREVLLDPLYEQGGTYMDTLQLDYSYSSPDSPYYLMELINEAIELQHEGIIMSIIGNRLPKEILREAHENGFFIESNQVPVNLLDPSCGGVYYNSENLLTINDIESRLTVDNTLAGGLLSSKFWNQPKEPYKYELSNSMRKNLHSLYEWSSLCGNRSNNGRKYSWKTFQEKMMDVLYDMSIKYQVTIEIIAMRWALQLENTSGIVVTADIDDKEGILSYHSEPEHLRQVFALSLEDNDIDRLWEVSGCKRPSSMFHSFDPENCEEQESGLFLP